MSLVLGLFCSELREVMGYVKVTSVINRTDDEISEESICRQIYDSWDSFQRMGGGKVSRWIDEHNYIYATQVEKFRVVII